LFSKYNLTSIKTKKGLKGGKIKIGSILDDLKLTDKKAINKFNVENIIILVTFFSMYVSLYLSS
jgi:hypothetical protein